MGRRKGDSYIKDKLTLNKQSSRIHAWETVICGRRGNTKSVSELLNN